MTAELSVKAVTTAAELDSARALFTEYGRVITDVAGRSLEHQGFDRELETLPGLYAPPRGRMYLACVDGEPIGCAALRPLDRLGPGVGEVKRMYVRPERRGLGLGHALIRRLVADARQIGYRTLKLDTSTNMLAAQHVYRAAGFVPCERYNDDPMEDTVWYELRL
ncbi:MAG: GNAT family N-acetyltransferase [Phycisphaerales bacterium]|nr:GNAT family N-acetyltransferase [Phycisphaerales bacterium]